MKKARLLMLSGLAALTLLAGCAAGRPNSPEIAATDGPNVSSDLAPVPLAEGELFYPMGEPVTIAQLEERFGGIAEFAASYSAGTGNTSVFLSWRDAETAWNNRMDIQLEGQGESLSFFEEFSDGSWHVVIPVEADKAIPLNVRDIWWTRADVSNPRGITMGMALEDVQAAYPEAVYVPYDLEPHDGEATTKYGDAVDGILHAFTIPLAELTVENDFVYPAEPHEYYEYATFHFKNGVLVAMNHGNGGLTFTP